MQSFMLEQTEGAPVSFVGELVGTIEARPVGTRQAESQHVLALYRPDDGTWVLDVQYRTTFKTDAHRKRVFLATDPHQLVGLLDSYDPATDRTGWPQGHQFERKREHVDALTRRNFRAAVNELLALLPGEAAEIASRSWRCDSCGEWLDDPAKGWIEWLEPEDGSRGHGLRLVHSASVSPREEGCTYPHEAMLDQGIAVTDDEMGRFLGPDGLMQLVGLLDSEQLPASEVVEMIKRLHVPLYEHARPYLPQAQQNGIIDLGMAPGCYSQSQLRTIITKYRDKTP